MGFLIQYLHLNSHSFLGSQHGNVSSVKAIMPLSATLPLVIRLNFFWLLIALLLYLLWCGGYHYCKTSIN